MLGSGGTPQASGITRSLNPSPEDDIGERGIYSPCQASGIKLQESVLKYGCVYVFFEHFIGYSVDLFVCSSVSSTCSVVLLGGPFLFLTPRKSAIHLRNSARKCGVGS